MEQSREEQQGEQASLWNGRAGEAWVESRDLLDGMLEPFLERLVDAAAHARHVLDVGCGTGSTTLAVARRTGASVLGVDISQPMIEAARQRAEGSEARFLVADAQSHAFEPGRFDLVISRFGVMFFAEPVRAFQNLRRAVADRGALRFVAWRAPAENAFMTVAERVARPLLPELPARRADGPGQFAFADADRVREILHQSGWGELDVAPLDVECGFPARELDGYVMRMGPLGAFLAGADADTRARVLAAVRPAFEPYVQGDQVRFTAACWEVGAHAA